MLDRLNELFPIRYTVFGLCVLGLLASLFSLLVFGVGAGHAVAAAGPGGASASTTCCSRAAPSCATTRSSATCASCSNTCGPEIRQYFLESDNEAIAVFARAALAGLPARQGRLRQAPVRNPARRPRRGLRVDQPLDGAQPHRHRTTSGSGSAAHRSRSQPAKRRCGPVHPALQRQHLQHLGHELRLAQRQCHPRAQCRRRQGAVLPTTPAKDRSRCTTGATAAT